MILHAFLFLVVVDLKHNSTFPQDFFNIKPLIQGLEKKHAVWAVFTPLLPGTPLSLVTQLYKHCKCSSAVCVLLNQRFV